MDVRDVNNGKEIPIQPQELIQLFNSIKDPKIMELFIKTHGKCLNFFEKSNAVKALKQRIEENTISIKELKPDGKFSRAVQYIWNRGKLEGKNAPENLAHRQRLKEDLKEMESEYKSEYSELQNENSMNNDKSIRYNMFIFRNTLRYMLKDLEEMNNLDVYELISINKATCCFIKFLESNEMECLDLKSLYNNEINPLVKKRFAPLENKINSLNEKLKDLNQEKDLIRLVEGCNELQPEFDSFEDCLDENPPEIIEEFEKQCLEIEELSNEIKGKLFDNLQAYIKSEKAFYLGIIDCCNSGTLKSDDMKGFYDLKARVLSSLALMKDKESKEIDELKIFLSYILESETVINHELNKYIFKFSNDLIDDFKNPLPIGEPVKRLQEMGRREYEIRNIIDWIRSLKRETPEIDDFELLHKEIINSLNLYKDICSQLPARKTSIAASEMGIAAQAGFRGLEGIGKSGNPVINKNVSSAQNVVLLKEEGVVYKNCSESAQEEEELIAALFNLKCERATVPSFRMVDMSACRIGIEVLGQPDRLRGFALEKIPKRLEDKIVDKLSIKGRRVFDHYEGNVRGQDGKMAMEEESKMDNPPNFTDKELASYHKCLDSKITWKYFLISDQKEEEINGIDFLTLYRKYFLDYEVPVDKNPDNQSKEEYFVGLIRPINNENKDSQNDLPNQQDIKVALRVLSMTDDPHFNRVASEDGFFVVPDLSRQKDREAYQNCEKKQWSIGQSREMSFKELHQRFLLEDPEDIKVFINKIIPAGLEDPRQREDLTAALQVQWKIVSPQIFAYNAEKSLSLKKELHAKPYVKEMELISNLQNDDPMLLEHILERLTPEAEYNAILTGEFQFQDLHHNNLGLAPEPNKEFKEYENIEFRHGGKNYTLTELIKLYLKGKIKEADKIKFKENDCQVEKSLRDLPALKSALNVPWKFVIFDADFCLGEDNMVQRHVVNGEEGHTIPLRSVLLEMDWKDKALSDECIERLEKSAEEDESDSKVRQWLAHEDAPILQHLSQEGKHTICQLLAPELEKFSKSENNRKYEKRTSLKLLKTQFAEDLCDLEKHHHFWKTLQEELSSVAVFKGATLASVARRYEQDPEKLKLLNPQIESLGEDEEIPIDQLERIRIDYSPSLTENSPEMKQKRKELGLELFPRMSLKQQQALIQRQNFRAQYLQNFRNLKEAQKGRLKIIKEFIDDKTSPLTREARVAYQKWIERVQQNNNKLDLDNLHKSLLKDAEPTYYNLLKAMYPLLGDSYDLVKHLTKSDAQSGRAIGSMTIPLEFIIRDIMQDFPINSEAWITAEELQKKIDASFDFYVGKFK